MTSEMTYSAFESRYRDRQYIGSGGFAKVYKVFDHAKNHYVAMKVADVRPEWKQFTLQREVKLVNNLPENRNIARYDACYRFNTGITGEIDFAILKFYEYGNLEQFLTKKQDLAMEDKRIIIKGILEGVAFLHRNSIIHRDLKSQNILLNREDGVWTPKITDFGLSKIGGDHNTVTNSAIGLSYAYAAPEQILNQKIYKNVDVWAAGVIIYRIIEGELPFKGRKGSDERSTQSQLELSRKIINLELPEKLNSTLEPYQSIIRRCLVLDPLERAESAKELIQLLNADYEMENDLNTGRGDDKTTYFSPASSTDSSYQENTGAATTGGYQSEEPTEVVRPKEEPVSSSPPPFYSAGTNYDMPRDNPTQFVTPVKKVEDTPPPPPPASFQPKTGEPGKRFNWLWVILPVLFLGGGYGIYLFIDSMFQPTVTEREVTWIHSEPTFYDIEALNESAKNNPEQLASVAFDIEQRVKEHPGEYKPLYVLAKNQIYQKEYERALELLARAAKVAVQRGNGIMKRMSDDMEADAEGSLKAFAESFQAEWIEVLGSLEEKY